MTRLDVEVVTTNSGARSILDRTTGEVMHPGSGAVAEAGSLYVEPARLERRLSVDSVEPLVLFDVGLGGGSNARAAFRVATSTRARPLHIVSFDRSCAALELACSEAHHADFGFDEGERRAARSLLENGHAEGPACVWRLVLGELPYTLDEPRLLADVVFWDPFSLRSNPDLWNFAALSRLRDVCRDGATVHTYSSATQVRAGLLLAGFFVGEGVSSGTDRPTTMAALDPSDLENPLGARWLERLVRSSRPFPSDAPEDALDRVRAHPQFRARR